MVREQRRRGSRRESPGRKFVVSAGSGKEVLGQQNDVVSALSERWQTDRDDREPVVEVFPKAPLAGPHHQVLVARRQDPGVHRLAPSAAEPADRPIFEDGEELALKR